MLDYFIFRKEAKAAFPRLIVSVMMYERGSGLGRELTIYRIKVAGMAIGADITSQGEDGAAVLAEVVSQVGRARAAVKMASLNRMLARSARAQLSGASGGLRLAA